MVAVAFVALVAATACGGVEHGVAVERVEAPPVGAMAVQPSLVAAGRSLVAVRGTEYERPEELAFSTDFGAHWRHVELPGAPDGDLAFATPTTLGDFVVVTARDHGEFGIPGSFVPHGRAFVWTTRDGIEWRGGMVADDGAVLSQLAVYELDGVLFAPFPTTRTLVVHRSRDGGETWDHPEVDGLQFDGSYLNPGAESATVGAVWRDGDRLYARVNRTGTRGPGGRAVTLDGGATWRFEACSRRQCTEPPLRAGSLLFGGAAVSPDGGETWQYALTRHEERFETVQVLSEGGWLAIVSGRELTEDAGRVTRVMRSDNGVHWRTLARDRCVRREPYAYHGTFSDPVPFGDGWLVAYACTHFEEGTAYYSDVFVTARDAQALTRIRDAHVEGAEYGQPVAVAGRVVIPELRDADNGTTRFVVLTPP